MAMQLSKKLNNILEENEPLLRSLSPEEISYKPLADKWSKQEILGHLIDSALNNYQRFIRAEEKGNLIFEGYNQDGWVAKNNYQNRDVTELISLFISINKHIAGLIAQLNENDLKKMTSDHNFDKICMRPLEKGMPSSLAYLIEDYIFHLKHHLKQIIG